ncbi:MAG: lysylphosphatidylglycerol synthase transmembrane domain-containing protein [Anaerolineae bacterium]
MLKQKRFWLGAIISLALLGYVFYQTNLLAIGAELSRANYFYLIPALVLYFIGVGIRSVRWHFLLRSIKPVPSRTLFPIVVIGYMANDILPARLGEVVRAFVLGQKEGISKTAALVTIVVERILDGLTMLAFLAGAALFVPLNDYLRTVLFLGGAVFVGIMLVLILVSGFRERLEGVINFILERLPHHWGDRAEKLIDSFLEGLNVLRNPLDALVAFACSVGAWLFEAGMYLLIALAFGLDKPFAMYILATALGNLASIAPSTPGYVGVFDAPIKYVLTTLYAVEINQATSYTLLLHAALLIPVTLLGFYYAWRAGLNLGQLSNSSQGGPEQVRERG